MEFLYTAIYKPKGKGGKRGKILWLFLINLRLPLGIHADIADEQYYFFVNSIYVLIKNHLI